MLLVSAYLLFWQAVGVVVCSHSDPLRPGGHSHVTPVSPPSLQTPCAQTLQAWQPARIPSACRRKRRSYFHITFLIIFLTKIPLHGFNPSPFTAVLHLAVHSLGPPFWCDSVAQILKLSVDSDVVDAAVECLRRTFGSWTQTCRHHLGWNS